MHKSGWEGRIFCIDKLIRRVVSHEEEKLCIGYPTFLCGQEFFSPAALPAKIHFIYGNDLEM